MRLLNVAGTPLSASAEVIAHVIHTFPSSAQWRV